MDNCCILADGLKSYTVVICTPNHKKLAEKLSAAESIDHSEKSLSQVIKLVESNTDLMAKLVKEVSAHGLSHGLQTFEIPTRIKFVEEVWLPESGLVTPSQKLMRREINKFYKNEIELLYK